MIKRRTLAGACSLAALAALPLVGSHVRADGPYVQVEVGRSFVCALDAGGELDCIVSPAFARLAPPSDLPALSAIEGGDAHACAITEAGAVRCWGDNDFGQLNVPALAEPVAKLAIGANTSCAIDAVGALACWGLDDNGQASPPASDSGFAGVAVGSFHACAVQGDGETVCWGQGGAVVVRPEPVGAVFSANRPPPGVAFETLSLGRNYSCGLTPAGEVRCWGVRSQAGFDGLVSLPVPEAGPYATLAVTGALSVCAIDLDGRIDCRGLLPDRLAAGPSGAGFVALDATAGTTASEPVCAIDAGGDVVCAGLGDGGGDTRPFAASDRAVLAPPTALRAERYSGTAAELFWEPVLTGIGPNAVRFDILGFEIYRDGLLLATDVPGSSFFDDTLSAGAEYTYTVIATNPDGARSEPSAPLRLGTRGGAGPGAPGGGYAVPPRPLEPTGLEARVYAPTTLELIWNRPTSPARGYEIRRNGLFLGFTSGTSFLDDGRVPGLAYDYDVLAIDRDGDIAGVASVVVGR